MKDLKTILIVIGILLGIFVTGVLALANGGESSPLLLATFFGGIAVFAVGAILPNKNG